MHICLVYDLLFPYTIGGAERWYRDLAERLAAEGHRVTYLTLRHWPDGEVVEVPGVEVVPVGPRLDAVHRKRTEADRAGASLRPRRSPPPHPRRRALRRGPHRLVPLLLVARGRAGPAATPCSDRRRLVRGLVERVLARIPRAGPGARRIRGATRAASACRNTLSASRGCSHDGCRSRACAAI